MKSLFLFLSLIILVRCDKNEDFIDSIKKKSFLNLKRAKVLQQFNPDIIYLMDEVIVLSSEGKDNMLFSIIDTVDFKEFVRFGKIGNGPDEIGIPIAFNKLNKDSLMIIDATDYHGYVYSIKRIISGNPNPVKTVSFYTGESKLLLNSAEITSTDNFIGAGIFSEEGRYAVFDSNGKTLGYHIKYPYFEKVTENEYLPAMIYQSVMCKKPGKDVFASLSNGTIDVISFDSFNSIELINRAVYYKPEMKYSGERILEGVNYPLVSTSLNSIAGFEGYHFQGSRNSFYALFTDRPLSDFIGHNARRKFKNLIEFNWNGMPNKNYELSEEVYGFSVSDNGNKIFFLGTNEKGESVIYKVNVI